MTRFRADVKEVKYAVEWITYREGMDDHWFAMTKEEKEVHEEMRQHRKHRRFGLHYREVRPPPYQVRQGSRVCRYLVDHAKTALLQGEKVPHDFRHFGIAALEELKLHQALHLPAKFSQCTLPKYNRYVLLQRINDLPGGGEEAPVPDALLDDEAANVTAYDRSMMTADERTTMAASTSS